jgi:iron complex transport system permease protein
VEAAAAPARAIRVRGVTPGWALAAIAFLVIAFAVGVVAGPVHIGVGDVLRSFGAKLGIPGATSPLDATQEAILWDLRVPRVLLAALVGGMLAIAGATYQGVFHNPLADPYLLGVAAGAGLGHARDRIPAARQAGRHVLPFAALRAPRSQSCSRTPSDGRRAASATPGARPRRRTVAASSRRFADVRAAAERGNAAGGHLWILGSLPTRLSDVIAQRRTCPATAVIVAMRRGRRLSPVT